jgi:hypothetical protein
MDIQPVAPVITGGSVGTGVCSCDRRNAEEPLDVLQCVYEPRHIDAPA